MLRLMLAVLCIAVVAQAAWADIAPEPITKAQSLAPRLTTSVSMDREHVQVTLTENKAHVKATFWMRNSSKSPTTLDVGFPDQHPTFGEFGLSVANLKVTVDGAEQEYEAHDKTVDQPAWYVWQMTFGSEQKRVIVVEYDCKTFRGREDEFSEWTEDRARTLDMCEGRLPEDEAFKEHVKEWKKNDIQRHHVVRSLRAARDREFGYVMATGAAWHGPIGEAVIEVKLADDAAKCIELLSPGRASWQNDTITWRFHNIEPRTSTNIVIGYRQGTYRQLGLKPGIESILAVLKDESHEHWEAVAELAKRIGTIECLRARRLSAARADESAF